MLRPRDVAAALRRNQFEFKFALEREVRLHLDAAAELAKSFIGVEQPGWDPLKPATIAQKAAKGYETPAPLLQTGELRDSISAETETTPIGVVGVVGSTDKVTLYQEVGTSRIPPRPFLAPALMSIEPELSASLGRLAVRALTPGERP